MELRHLRYFVAVAETENVSRAALKLRVSQPGLSRQVRDLEAELGIQLLERGAKSVRLTEAGRVFLGEARAVLQRVEVAVQAGRAVASGSREELHIGYAPTLTVRLMPAALRRFQAAMPAVRVKLHDLSTEEMLAGLREGKLHISFMVVAVTGMPGDLRYEQVLSEPLRLAVLPTHPLARRRVASLADAAREPFIAYSRKEYPDYHDLLAEIFASVQAKPRIVEEHDGVSSLISAVETGNGVAIVPQALACTVGSRLKLVALSPEPPPLLIGAVWHPSGLTGAAETFVSLAKAASVQS